jgi:ADP-ribosylglycohydrolase
MKGSILGDIIGSAYEFRNTKDYNFKLFPKSSKFTDDTVLTIATMDVLLERFSFNVAYKRWFRKYPECGFAPQFRTWGRSDTTLPYNSWGNGSAMRVSPVAMWYATLEQTLAMAKQSAMCTHNHPEGVKGAQATAAVIFMARNKASKEEICNYIQSTFGYELRFTLDSIRPTYTFDVSCQGSVPQAIVAFLEGKGFEDTIRKAVSLGGDSDTIACIAGGMAEAYYGIPAQLESKLVEYLPVEMIEKIDKFYAAVALRRGA